MLASAAKPTKSKRQKIQIKEKKLNFVLIQSGKILVIFICLQAKLQLFQECRALFEIFFAVVRKKLVFWKLNDCSKNFTMQQSRKKAFISSIYSVEEIRKLNTAVNIVAVAKIDIDALKSEKKSRINDTENRLKIKNSQSQL